MPELPEVETVRRGLAPVMEGRRITNAEARRPDLRWPFPERFAERLSGQRVLHLGRRGKYLLAELEGGETLLAHLGMSGRFQVEGEVVGRFHHTQPGKHDHVILETDAPARITYTDPRRFGAMDLWPSATLEGHRWLTAMGPEPLGNGFSTAVLAEALRRRSSPIKQVLLDQTVVAGLGNIYVSEALFHAGIHPSCVAQKMSVARINRLVEAIRTVLCAAIEAGGSSLRDHRQTNGDLGYFQHSFQVYGRESQACARAGCAGAVHRITQSGRSSFFCPHCQR